MSANSRYDSVLAESLIGSYVLIGLTRTDPRGEMKSQEQLHGVVESVDEKYGICVALKGVKGGESYTLPPDTRGISAANPGEYRLRSTGEVVIDPDFLCSWTISMKVDD